MNQEDAYKIIEDGIDVLMQVGNGTTDEMLHQLSENLMAVRDNYLAEENPDIIIAGKTKGWENIIILDSDGGDLTKKYYISRYNIKTKESIAQIVEWNGKSVKLVGIPERMVFPNSSITFKEKPMADQTADSQPE